MPYAKKKAFAATVLYNAFEKLLLLTLPVLIPDKEKKLT